jgi:ParB-like chromosome segregation protein Spo0J
MRHKPESLIEVVRSGVQLPPIVVVNTAHRFVLVDGLHRTYAAWALGQSTIEAYELMP